MPPQELIDLELIVARSRILWRDASARVSTGRVELFAKVSSRVRVTRDLRGTGATVDRTGESGLAVRAIHAGRDRAGFAASSGMGLEDVRWATESAAAYGAHASAVEPRPSDIAPERWDLDDPAPLPSEDHLITALLSRTGRSWVEAGTTIEVLVGTGGWIAARRRHRLWALAEGPGPQRLSAQRGFADWEARLEADEAGEPRAAQAGAEPGETLILAPRAAAPIVAALVDAFHREGKMPRSGVGQGWEIADDPCNPVGLSGGSFDDVGFPTKRRILASGGLWVDELTGPGTYKRSSFRDPPAESASNLVMAGDPIAAPPPNAAIVRRCRVIRPSPELWVLELELDGTPARQEPRRHWIRVGPEALIQRCRSRLGGAQLTPEAPIVPFLLFDPLPAL